MGIVWFNGKEPWPPPKLWTERAIVAEPVPGISLSEGEGKVLRLTYTLENNSEDYRIEYDALLTTLLRSKQGALSEPVPGGRVHIEKPVFIPVGQKAFLTLTLIIPALPEREVASSTEYVGIASGFLQGRFRNEQSFVVFDPAANTKSIYRCRTDEEHADNNCGHCAFLDDHRQSGDRMLYGDMQVGSAFRSVILSGVSSS